MPRENRSGTNYYTIATYFLNEILTGFMLHYDSPRNANPQNFLVNEMLKNWYVLVVRQSRCIKLRIELRKRNEKRKPVKRKSGVIK